MESQNRIVHKKKKQGAATTIRERNAGRTFQRFSQPFPPPALNNEK
jgi:hypothetical protein